MLSFQPIAKEKIQEYKRYYNDPDALGCESNFVSGYLWSAAYKLRVAFVGDTLVKAYFRDDRRVWGYCMPRGKQVAAAVEALFADAAERCQTVRIAYMTQAERNSLEQLFPGRFRYQREEENQEYLYLSRDLAMLPGKKYHAKRNHISKFYRTYGEDVQFFTLNTGNLADAQCVMDAWCRENGCDLPAYEERVVFQKACESFEELQLHGAVLYVKQMPVAMTMGCPVSPRCFDVMFEKALRAYDGVYAVINREFAKTLTRYEYINREEDLGIEGLRKAKLSYHPAMIYDRYSAIPL